MVKIVAECEASDGVDVQVVLDDGRPWTFHSACGYPDDLDVWVADCEKELLAAELIAVEPVPPEPESSTPASVKVTLDSKTGAYTATLIMTDGSTKRFIADGLDKETPITSDTRAAG